MNLKNRNPNLVAVLALHQKSDEKVFVSISVGSKLVSKIGANTLIQELSHLINAKGGGKPDLAQCGGDNPAGIDRFFAAVEDKIKMIERHV